MKASIETPAHRRLRDARIIAGFKSASDAARALEVARATYVQHENGTRGMQVETFDRYMAFFAARGV